MKKIIIILLIMIIVFVIFIFSNYIAEKSKDSIKTGYDFSIYCGEIVSSASANNKPLRPTGLITEIHYYIYNSEKKVRVYYVTNSSPHLENQYKISKENLEELQNIMQKVVKNPNDFLEEDTSSYLEIRYNNTNYKITKKDSVTQIENLFKK